MILNLSSKAAGSADESDYRLDILRRSLPYVKELGWSNEALAKGATDLG